MLRSLHLERMINMSEKKNLRDLVLSDETVTFSRIYPDVNSYAGMLKNNEVHVCIKSGKLTASSNLNISNAENKFMNVALDLRQLFIENDFVSEDTLNSYANNKLRLINNITNCDFRVWPNYDPIFLRVIGLGLFKIALDAILEEYTL